MSWREWPGIVYRMWGAVDEQRPSMATIEGEMLWCVVGLVGLSVAATTVVVCACVLAGRADRGFKRSSSR